MFVKGVSGENTDLVVFQQIEVKNSYYSHFLFPLPISLDFYDLYLIFFKGLHEILMRSERNHDLILALGLIRQILCDLAF